MTHYRWMTLGQLESWVDVAKQEGVSARARSRGQFVDQFRRVGGRWQDLPDFWWRKRQGFVARHLEQARRTREKLYDRRNGSYSRRGLALLMWAFDPRWVAEGQWYVMGE